MPKGGTKKRPSASDPAVANTSAASDALNRKKTRHGDSFAAGRIGPKNLEEVFGWPREVLDIMKSDEEQFATLVNALGSHGVTMGTFYSGMLTPEVAMQWVLEALKKQYGVDGKLVHAWACDHGAGPQIVMNAMLEQVDIKNLYNDLHDFLAEPARAVLDEIETEGATKSKAGMAEMYERMADAMLGLEKTGKLFDADKRVHCIKYMALRGMCSWNDGDGDHEDGSLKVCVGGSTCTGWSTRGLRLREADQSMKPFLVFVFLIRWLRPHILLHECTVAFDPALLTRFLGHAYMIQSFVVSPQLLGLPVQRPRRYSICINTEMASFKGSVEEFEMQFASTVELTGDVYFVAGEDMLQDEGDDMKTDWRQFYTATTVQRLEELEKLQLTRGALEGDFIVETDQGADYQAFEPGSIPCLCSSSRIYSFTRRRHLLPVEHLLVQGMPSLVQCSAEFALPWASALQLGLLGRRQILQLAANGMHSKVVGSLLAYVLSKLHKHAVVSVKAHKLLAIGESEVEFDQEEDLDVE